MTGTFQILYFASASSYTHKDRESLPAPLAARKLFDLLEARYPGIRENVLCSCAVTVGLEYVDTEELEGEDAKGDSEDGGGGGGGGGGGVMIQEGDEVAIIPPVSSG